MTRRYLSGAFAGEDIIESFNLRDSLVQLVHEISENALSHGIASRINQNRHNHPVDFGRLFVFQISRERIGPKKVYGENQVMPGLIDFHAHYTKQRDVPGQNGAGELLEHADDPPEPKKTSATKQYLVLSFFDTGMGIEEHMRKYGNEPEGPARTIPEIANGNLSTRSLSGSGHGLQNIFKLTEELQAFIVFRTSRGTYTYNGITGKGGAQKKINLPRGTLISLYLPVRV